MKTKPIGLYLHTPLCVKKCSYCDFCSYPAADADWRNIYINLLCDEIESYKGRAISVDTVFFGGGTPSLLTPSEFEKICGSIHKTFHLSSDIEFTIEANPKTLTRENLLSYIRSGVNRLSIGLQTIHENELKILGRIHNYDDFLESYDLARALGINNINIDLMYGIPKQTVDSFNITLDKVIKLSPEHLSLYGLILEEGTPFWRMKNKLPLPSEDIECDMYYLAAKKLRESGFSHYEISNYAKPGIECRHNLKYWRCEEYIGVGVSAYSYYNGERYGNFSDIHEYLSKKNKEYSYIEKVSRDVEIYERVMLGLRLREGISLNDYRSRYGEDFILPNRNNMIDKYIDGGYMVKEGDRLSLTEQGFYVSNTILTELL